MSPFDLDACARPNILALQPYRCARDDYQDDGRNILLDANENAFGPSIAPPSRDDGGGGDADPGGLHRYPDPHQLWLKQQLCDLRNAGSGAAAGPLTPDHLFVGVGSDEVIDALLRCFCVPGRDAILTCPPTYGMYSVAAQVNDVTVVPVPLLPAPGFGLDVAAVTAELDDQSAADGRVKLVYLCSPGNPTGALLARADVERLLAHPTWNGIIVVDEAYIDFAGDDASLAPLVAAHPNLVVMQTLSKAFGMAGIRLGAAFAAPPVARLLNALKAPYNVPSLTSALAGRALAPPGLALMRRNRARIRELRDGLLRELPAVPGVGRLRGGTDANFVLYEMLDARGRPDNATALAVYQRLAGAEHVVVRFRGTECGCLGCLRITVGTDDECARLLDALRKQLAEVRGAGAVANGAPAASEQDCTE